MRALPLLLALAALAACGGAAEPEATPPPPAEEASELTLDDFRGEPVLVNVWSSW